MDKRTPSLTDETKALKEAYAALNRNDIPAFVEIFDPQIERIEPDDFPGGGTYHGLAAVMAHISKARGAWAEGSCEPERFVVKAQRILLVLRQTERAEYDRASGQRYSKSAHQGSAPRPGTGAGGGATAATTASTIVLPVEAGRGVGHTLPVTWPIGPGHALFALLTLFAFGLLALG